MRSPVWLSLLLATLLELALRSGVYGYWMTDIQRQGKVAFRANASDGYPVFRNVMDYGAKGDGITDDTEAINNAVSAPGFLGNGTDDGKGIPPNTTTQRCGGGISRKSIGPGGVPVPGNAGQYCGSSTLQPALVYFPPGIYVVKKPIVLWYMTQMVGDAQNPPTILVDPLFRHGGNNSYVDRNDTNNKEIIGRYVFDANIYIDGFYDPAKTWWDNQNNFYRQIRNFKFDLRNAPQDCGAVHWQVAQATSMQNLEIYLRPKSDPNNEQVGIFMENGSGGWFSDITIYGGYQALVLGSQQFTIRKVKIQGSTIAVKMIFGWTWLFAQFDISECTVGFDFTLGGDRQGTTHATMIVDSVIGAQFGVVTRYKPGTSLPPIAGSLMLERVDFTPSAIAVSDGTLLTSNVILRGSQFIPLWVQGNIWTVAGRPVIDQYFNSSTCSIQNTNRTVREVSLVRVQQSLAPIERPKILTVNDAWFGRARPQYEDIPASGFLSAKTFGLAGDGATDDSTKMQDFFNTAASQGKVAYFDKGAYIVEKTVQIPKDLKITGELWPLIMARGSFFNNQNDPKVVWRVGNPGELGSVEMSDIVFETQGPCPGAILIEWNIKQRTPGAAGMWDAHYRIGGTAGTDILVDKCRKTPNITITASSPKINDCYGAFLLLHVTPQANIYMENVWGWVSDHQLDAPDRDQIYVFNGRGFLIEGDGPNWLWGTASEHSVLYSYQFLNAKNTWLGIIQHETAYYQPNPRPPFPFDVQAKYADPDFADCKTANCARTWGLRFVNSSHIYNYGSGGYMFFDNWLSTCLDDESCQQSMNDYVNSTDIWAWGMATKGGQYMVNWDGTPSLPSGSNKGSYLQAAILFEMTGNF